MYSSQSQKQSPVVQPALNAIWPICMGYLPLGLAMGVLGEKAGLTPFQVMCMSLVVFAGSGQFIAVSMITAGASTAAIVLTTFMVNLRHLLMSSSLAVHYQGACRKKVSLLSHGIVDETFAVNLNQLKRGHWPIELAIASSYAAWISWAVSTTLGCFCGQFIPTGAFGLDYALTAMFICLLVYQLGTPLHAIVALISGALATAISLSLPGNAYIVIATILAASLGLLIKKTGIFSVPPKRAETTHGDR